MKKSQLTIAIPTYNRPQQIISQIHALIPQLNDEVKIVVIDNHSDQPVESLLPDIATEKITIVRNKYNIGADANIAKCFELCKTKWLWTLSDDDPVCPNAVETILRRIKLSVNECFISFNNNCDFASNDINDLISKSRAYQDFYYMSLCVYNMEMLSPFMYHYYRALSSMQPGVFLLIKTLEQNNEIKCAISKCRIIGDGSKNISWNRLSFVYASLFFLDLLRDTSRNYSLTIKRPIVGDCLYSIVFSHRRGYLRMFESWGVVMDIIKRRGIINTLFVDIKEYLKIVYYNFILGQGR